MGDLLSVGSGGGSSTIQEDIFAPANLQTVFTLSQTWSGGFAIVFVNGIEYVLGSDFTIVGTTLTWLDVPFTLALSDRLAVDYVY